LAKDPLATAEAVDLGRVKQRHAQLDGPRDDELGVPFGVLPAVAPFPGAELPSAEADLGDLDGRCFGIQIAHEPSIPRRTEARDAKRASTGAASNPSRDGGSRRTASASEQPTRGATRAETEAATRSERQRAKLGAIKRAAGARAKREDLTGRA